LLHLIRPVFATNTCTERQCGVKRIFAHQQKSVQISEIRG
jgi:hypothetical protein